MKRAVVGALLVVAIACSSDQRRVANALAARHYNAGEWALQYLPPGVTIEKATENQMRHACDAEPTHQKCLAYSRAINRLDHEAVISNEAQKLGKLPPTARKNLKIWTDCVERRGQCPALKTSVK